MHTRLPQDIFLLAGMALAHAACAAAPPPCPADWYRAIEAKLRIADAEGHGPDLGSDEWKSAVEFRLGVRDRSGVPGRDSAAWCRYVDAQLGARATGPASRGGAPPRGPSFDCRNAETKSIEAMVCSDDQLSALDRRLAAAYAAASAKAADEHPPMLKAEQRGWIKGRDECWKRRDTRACVRSEYVRRIAELQARYRLVRPRSPFRWSCDGNPANEVTITFFATDPPTLIAEHGDSTALMFLAPSGSGTKYEGRNEIYWEHQDEARITWGYGARAMRCTRQP